MTFSVKQRVQCVETWIREDGYGDEIGPVAGEIYTVRMIGIGLNPEHPSGLQVRLFEIFNEERPYRCGMYEPAFRASRFRPLTSISFAHEILRKASRKQGAEA